MAMVTIAAVLFGLRVLMYRVLYWYVDLARSRFSTVHSTVLGCAACSMPAPLEVVWRMVPVLMLYLRLQCTSTVSILPVVPVVGRPCCTTGSTVFPVRYRSICSTQGFPRWAVAYLSFCLSHFDSTGTGTGIGIVTSLL